MIDGKIGFPASFIFFASVAGLEWRRRRYYPVKKNPAHYKNPHDFDNPFARLSEEGVAYRSASRRAMLVTIGIIIVNFLVLDYYF